MQTKQLKSSKKEPNTARHLHISKSTGTISVYDAAKMLGITPEELQLCEQDGILKNGTFSDSLRLLRHR